MAGDWRQSLADLMSRPEGVALLLALLVAALLFVLHARASRQLAEARGEIRRHAEERDRGSVELMRLDAELGAVRARHDSAAIAVGQLEARLEDRDRQLERLSEEREALDDVLFKTRSDIARLERELGETRLAARKDLERAEHDIANLRALRDEMTAQFRQLSDETLRSQGADMRQAHGEQLSALLTPFREQVAAFKEELGQRNKMLDEEGARLREQIRALNSRSEEISREAVALTRALKGDKQRQGAWGEMILERILEDSGLEPGLHYDAQSSFRDDEGGLWRPDVVVRMPRKKLLVIDSKVSLNAYEEAVNAEDNASREAALRRHVQAIRSHVQTLAAKGYERMDDASVDYVLMFIPIEGAFSEALRVDPTLARAALEQRVGLATPTTLMLTLRTVEHIWTVERRETNAMEIASRAGQLYDKVAGFVDSAEGVEKALATAQRCHAQAMDRLSRGPGNVLRQVEMLRELGARAQKRIERDHDRDDGETPLALAGGAREDAG